jgi:hypothetical protein
VRALTLVVLASRFKRFADLDRNRPRRGRETIRRTVNSTTKGQRVASQAIDRMKESFSPERPHATAAAGTGFPWPKRIGDFAAESTG